MLAKAHLDPECHFPCALAAKAHGTDQVTRLKPVPLLLAGDLSGGEEETAEEEAPG